MYRCTFNPPEEELINYYLNNKITENDDLVGKQIAEVNICHHEPADLPGLAKIESSHTWYFISPVEKFGKLNRTKRVSRSGHWKITGNSRTIKDDAFVLCKLTKKTTRTRRSGAISEEFPPTLDLSLTSDPILHHPQVT
ncbi:unnamed protein product [Arabidopsis thaliana]|uniref:(thale cress) hypothetical protein n=1 Tax=Arabidopsis thaliana TaxID=3702 RepID=A0A7G2EIX7_ARATH|nr:unnamed protein product [Arabidopsis thaliana]